MRIKVVLGLIIFLGAILRLYFLGVNPPSLYWDEVSLGYNAFSVSQTLRDEHGVFLPLTSFAAFGDYKPVGYIYALVPFVKLLGLTEFAVRLPSALAGTLLVWLTYLLVNELQFSRRNQKLSLLAALFVAVSPWSLQMSRAAFEANLATLFSGFGAYFFLKAVRTKSFINIPLSILGFVFAIYTFNSHRVFVPILIAILVLIFLKDLLPGWKRWVAYPIIFFVLLLPLIPFVLSREGKLRFNEVTWTNDLSLVEQANENIASANNALWAKVIYNRRVLYGAEFARHYFDHYRFDFLFQTGDINPRLSTRSVGEMYLFDLPLLLAGIYFLLRKHDKMAAIIFAWVLIAPIPAAVARETPHALRILNILPVPQIVSAFGLLLIWRWLGRWGKMKVLMALAFGIIVTVQVYSYLQNYYLVYPGKYSTDWQYGYKQMVQYVSGVQNNYDHIWVTGRLGRPYIYFLFYNQYPPEKYWSNRQASRDQFGFWSVYSFDKYQFAPSSLPGRWLYVADPDQGKMTDKGLKYIFDPAGRPVFAIYEKTI